MAAITKARGETFRIHPTVTNSGSPQTMRIRALLVENVGGAVLLFPEVTRDMLTGESTEYTLELVISDTAPPGIYSSSVGVYEEALGGEAIATYEEADVLEVVVGPDKEIVSVRYT